MARCGCHRRRDQGRDRTRDGAGSIGIAAAGCGLGQGRAAAAALEGIARNPSASDKLFTPFILGLALIESLAIYALVVAILLLAKVPNLPT